MKDLGKGIAILGIWGCVAVVGYKEPVSVCVLGIFAVIATLFVSSSGGKG